jgi:hypothetical protein
MVDDAIIADAQPEITVQFAAQCFDFLGPARRQKL